MAPTLSALMAATDGGDRSAADALFSALYGELHELARRQLAGAGARLSPTTLLHEAYINMSRREGIAFPDRARFIGYAAKVMRGILIDHARSRGAQKRGGGLDITTLDEESGASVARPQELEQVGAAIDELATVDAPLAALVDLRFFCGFSVAEIAAIRGVSERTVFRDWERARAYLHRRIREAAV